jgi:hypothetical protein
MKDVILAILGYAIGTAQVLFVDWAQRRREHRRQLRLLRAEFRRGREMLHKFQWKRGVPPESDEIPYPPRVSEQFIPTVAVIDYYLTDEHDDDNAQQAHLNLIDGINQLELYHRTAMELVDKARAEQDSNLAREHLDRAVENAGQYDLATDRVGYIIDSALKDLQRRLDTSRLWPQIRRVGRQLREGENPPPLTKDDPRLLRGRDGTGS